MAAWVVRFGDAQEARDYKIFYARARLNGHVLEGNRRDGAAARENARAMAAVSRSARDERRAARGERRAIWRHSAVLLARCGRLIKRLADCSCVFFFSAPRRSHS